jgi:D-alanyl-D-alanine endopeptidase (penicillin-binding protein 7)
MNKNWFSGLYCMQGSRTAHRTNLKKLKFYHPFRREVDSHHAGVGLLRAFRSKTAVLVLFLIGFLSTIEAGPSINVRNPRLRSAAAIVQDQNTDELLLSKKAGDVMPIASITKLMTAMVLLDSGINMGMPITIEETDKDKLRYSRSNLKVGTRLSRMQALLLALMASENRAAHALARTYPGGTEEFVRAMNRKAQALGLTETRFKDSSGLSGGNVSSAQDLCSLVNAAYRYTLIRDFSTRKEFTFKNGRRMFRFVNTNSLVRNAGWDIGLSKTGYIQESGRCLVMQTSLRDRHIVIVLLNASGERTRINDVLRIKRWLEQIELVQDSQKQQG